VNYSAPVFRTIKSIYFFIPVCLILQLSNLGFAQEIPAMKVYRKQAQELMNTNKTAQALDVLEQAGKTQTTHFRTERDSILTSLATVFATKKQLRLSEITKKNAEITELKSGNEDIDQENFKMIRNTLFFFGILLGMAVLLLLNKFRTLAKLKEQIIASDLQVAEIEKLDIENRRNIESAKTIYSKWKTGYEKLDGAYALISKIATDKLHSQTKGAQQLVSNSQIVNHIIESEENTLQDDKIPVDLNQLIEMVINQAYYNIIKDHPDYGCTIVKDLEKILPKISLNPHDIRFVMFNLLNNAFEAVRQKRVNAPKGYEPKVTVSTRKLPRFVQIRVRDNGIGIQEKNPEKVFDAFYSTKNSSNHPGLGLSESRNIITKTYKGELFIESDFTTGTDFIIRFPILTLM